MQIDIDFDVFKTLTAMRETEETTYNEVLRRLLELPARKSSVRAPSQASDKSFIADGVEFPHDTEFRMRHRGQFYSAKVSDGCLLYNGKRYTAVSAPACEITATSINGWKYWECRFPGHIEWHGIDTLRHRSQGSAC
jgi:hypothetical protein